MIGVFAKVTETLGIIAGGGPLPSRVAEALDRSGQNYVMIALTGVSSPETISKTDHCYGMGALGRVIDTFQDHHIAQYIMIGPVTRPGFDQLELDAVGNEVIERFLAQGGGGDDALLRLITERLAEAGLVALPAESVLVDVAAPDGLLSAAEATKYAADIALGRALLEQLSPFDVGQACVVESGQVLAIEGPEGTDNMLRRVQDILSARGERSPNGVLVKLPKAGQERRVDLPTLGPQTVEGVRDAGLAGLVYQGGGTLLIDREACVALANRHHLFLLGL